MKVLKLLSLLSLFIATPALAQYVHDDANVLSQDDKTNLNKKIKDFEETQKNQEQILVFLEPEIKEDTPENFATQMGNTYHVGQKDKSNGYILVFDLKNHKDFLATGSGSTLTDIQSKNILDTLKPDLKEKNYTQAIQKVLTQLNNYDQKENESEIPKIEETNSQTNLTTYQDEHKSNNIIWTVLYIILGSFPIFTILTIYKIQKQFYNQKKEKLRNLNEKIEETQEDVENTKRNIFHIERKISKIEETNLSPEEKNLLKIIDTKEAQNIINNVDVYIQFDKNSPQKIRIPKNTTIKDCIEKYKTKNSNYITINGLTIKKESLEHNYQYQNQTLRNNDKITFSKESLVPQSTPRKAQSNTSNKSYKSRHASRGYTSGSSSYNSSNSYNSSSSSSSSYDSGSSSYDSGGFSGGGGDFSGGGGGSDW